jgi:hypothetical protein
MRKALGFFLLTTGISGLAACLSYSSPTSGVPGADASVSDGTLPGDAGVKEGGDSAIVVVSSGTVSLTRDGGVPISPLAFGQNYWDWVDWADSGVTGLTGTEPLVKSLQLNVIRAGGDNNDTNSPSFFDTAQIDKFVAYCRSVGAEPILQVPLVANNVDGGAATPQTAADMVTYANVTKGYGIKYWEIGNEPDIYPMNTDAGFPIQTATAYCTAFIQYETAMKAANAAGADGGVAIQFLGPELAYQYIPGSDWLTPFLDQCKDYVDIVTIHRYPFSGMTDSTVGAVTGGSAFQSTLTSVAAIVKAHARPNAPLGVTESNISYDYAKSVYSDAGLQAAPGTFYAALWTADVMGTALENHLWTLAFWNIGETGSGGSILGFIESEKPVPAYYAEQMISANFRGTMLTPAGVPTGFSVYASYDSKKGETAVMVINLTAPSTGLTLAVDTLPAKLLTFPALSMTLVRIPDTSSGSGEVLQYTQELADAGMPPQTTP